MTTPHPNEDTWAAWCVRCKAYLKTSPDTTNVDVLKDREHMVCVAQDHTRQTAGSLAPGHGVWLENTADKPIGQGHRA